MTPPSEVLTETIAALLVESKLFLSEDADKYKIKIAAGMMKAEDWLLTVEKALDKEHSQ